MVKKLKKLNQLSLGVLLSYKNKIPKQKIRKVVKWEEDKKIIISNKLVDYLADKVDFTHLLYYLTEGVYLLSVEDLEGKSLWREWLYLSPDVVVFWGQKPKDKKISQKVREKVFSVLNVKEPKLKKITKKEIEKIYQNSSTADYLTEPAYIGYLREAKENSPFVIRWGNLAGYMACLYCGHRIYDLKDFYKEGDTRECECVDGVRCTECGELLEENKGYETENEVLCEKCFCEKYSCCVHCGHIVKKVSSVYFKGCYWCDECVKKVLRKCEGCNKTEVEQEMKIINNKEYCKECVEVIGRL